MTERSFPFSGTTPGDAGPYTATFFADFMRATIGQELRPNSGVNYYSGDGTNDPLEVTQTSPATANVRIREGTAFVRGYFYWNDSDFEVNIPANLNGSGFDRIDTLALQVHFVDQKVRIVNVEGTPAAIPAPPTLTQNDLTVWQIPLADIQVANLFSQILTADIDNAVREYARLLPWQEGGTGLAAYSDRQKLMGQANGALEIEYLSGFSIENRTDPSSDLASGSWQKLQIQEKNDTDGLITVASDVITVAKAGYYTMVNLTAQYSGITTNGVVYFRLRDTTANVTLWVSGTYNNNVGATNRDSLGCANFAVPSDGTTIEIQTYRSVGSTRFETSAANPGGSETEKCIQADFIRWG